MDCFLFVYFFYRFAEGPVFQFFRSKNIRKWTSERAHTIYLYYIVSCMYR